MRAIRCPKFRFSLRTFLIVCVLPVPFLAWLASAKVKAVRQQQAVSYFERRGCDIGFDSAAHSTPSMVKSICDFIDPNIALRVPYVRVQQSLRQEDIERLARLQGLRDVYFCGRVGQPTAAGIELSDGDVRRLISIESLAGVTLDAEIEVDSLRGLASLPELHSIALPAVKFDAHLLEALSKKPKIASLEFDASALETDALEHMRRLPMLQALVLHRLSPAKLSGLENCRALTALALYDCTLSASDAKSIKSLRIRTLDLVNPSIEKGFFRKLERHPTIVRMTVQIGAVYFSTSSTADEERPVTLAELEYCEDHFTIPKVHSSPKTQSTP